MNLEFFAIDSQGFITDHERALEDLFGDEETSRKGDACLNVMASRIATVFASLREFPTVRYRAAKSLDASTMTTMRDLIPTKLAAGIWNCLAKHKQSIENFPQTETCELLILDRSIDQIAPIIHEWTYDAMCHDLLNMDGNKYVHVIPSKSGGQPEKKDVLLEEHDPIWLELRHAHIADASERLHDKMTNFLSKNKAAQLQHGKRDGGELSTRDLQKMVQALPQYSEQIDKLSLHVEMNLEFFAIDSQGFITDHERALEDLFGDEETSRKGDACLNVMASRIATVFASLREFPTVRYRAAKSLDASTMTTMRDLIPTKLAAGIWNCLAKHKQSIENFPQTETCELLILDRSIDQIAPIIHEWTYDAMCHDLLNMDGNKYVHVIPSKSGGQPEKKDVLLEEHDPIWLELRHAHIADVSASERLHDKMTNFLSKNKAAQLQHGKRDGGELSTRDLQKMVQALPQYSEQIDKLSLHVEIARKINDLIREQGLRELGQLEQDLVFGDAGMKDVIKYLSTQEEASREGKLRLLMILATIYPEKFEGEKGQNLMK
ncbi:hypothetical protein F2Q70_00041809, partial [Brassica cretica]